MNRAYMQYETDLACYRWHGGEYIEVGYIEIGTEEPIWHGIDAINVWDYKTDKPRIARTLEAFQERCDAHTNEQSEEGSECPYCGEQPAYCQGHGEIGDPDGFAYLQSLNEETS